MGMFFVSKMSPYSLTRYMTTQSNTEQQQHQSLSTTVSYITSHSCFLHLLESGFQIITLELLNCLLLFYIHSKLELPRQFPASNDEKYSYLWKNGHRSPRVLPRHWAVVGGLGIKNVNFHATAMFFILNILSFPCFFPTVVVGGMSECWVRPPSAAHCGQNPNLQY